MAGRKGVFIELDEERIEDLRRLARANNMSVPEVVRNAVFANVRKTPRPMREFFNELTVVAHRLKALLELAAKEGHPELVPDIDDVLARVTELMDIAWNFVEARRRRRWDEEDKG